LGVKSGVKGSSVTADLTACKGFWAAADILGAGYFAERLVEKRRV
jgi:hypothetical protein